jgi:hypothetical protein
MKVQYDEGPESQLIRHAGVIAERGQAVEVPDDIGKQLLTQGWSQVGKSTPKKESK